MITSTGTLPEGYREIFSVDLQKNKKNAILVNGLGLVIAAVLAVAGCFAVPLSELYSMEEGLLSYCIRFVSLLVLMVLYIVLHELVHGIAMKLCGTKKVKYGFTGMYAFAGSDDYYGKKPYLFIALAPVVLWGIVIGVAAALVPDSWFWILHILQIVNLSGAAGDFYVTVRFWRLPADILVKDYGVGMHVFSAQ